MSYQVSARRHRPQRFDDVVGQPHIVRTLSNAITAERIAHAYLFSGTRGVGKTTVARIFAKALNCQQGPSPTPCNTCETCQQVTEGVAADVLEIDGASNNGVESVRDLTDNIRYRPLSCRYKIYIIDEVHMLTTPAFNALLKTLEEPPEHAVFLFATTETHKIPKTILSRCQHHAFRRVSRDEIATHLSALATQDGLEISRTALGTLARAADGSVRDSLSLFDQAVSFSGAQVTDEDVTLMLGTVHQATLVQMAGQLLAGDASAILTGLKTLCDRGQDLGVLSTLLVEHFRNLLMCRVSRDPSTLVDLAEDDLQEVARQAADAPQEVIVQILTLLSDVQERCRRSQHPRYLLEAALVRACEAEQLVALSTLLAQYPPADSAPPSRQNPAQPTPVRPAPTGPPAVVTRPSAQATPVVSAPAPTPPPTALAAATPSPVAKPMPMATAPAPAALVASASTALSPAPPRSEEPPLFDYPELAEMPTSAAPSKAPAAAPLAAPPTRSPVAPAAITTATPPAAAAPPATAAPVSQSPAAPVGDQIKDAWGRVVQDIRRRRPPLASYLEQGAVTAAGDGQIQVGYPPAYEVMFNMINREDNRAFISRVATELMGHPVQVQFVMLDQATANVTTLAQEFEAQAQETHRQEVASIMELPYIQDVLTHFGGEVLELHKPNPEG